MSVSKSARDEVRRIIAECARQGCTVELRKGGHYKVTTPSGGVVFMAATPSDKRGPLNSARDLRHAGVEVGR